MIGFGALMVVLGVALWSWSAVAAVGIPLGCVAAFTLLIVLLEGKANPPQ